MARRARELDLSIVLGAFERNRVQYILIGGQAGIVWGSPLLTEDFDAVYARDRDNLERVVAALRELHARVRVPGVDEERPFQLDATTLERGFNFTFGTDAGPVDLLGLPAGVDGFPELEPNSVQVQIAGHRVRVAALDDLIRMKVAAGRPKDRAAVETLVALRDERERQGRYEP
jgi:hypothetical protein